MQIQETIPVLPSFNRDHVRNVIDESLFTDTWLDSVRLLRSAGISIQISRRVPLLTVGGHVVAFSEVCPLVELSLSFKDWESLTVDFEHPDIVVDALAARLVWMEETGFTWDIPRGMSFLQSYVARIGLPEVRDAVRITFRRRSFTRRDWVRYFRGVCKGKIKDAISEFQPIPPCLVA